MTISISPTAYDINVVLRRFVMSCLPDGVEVIKGQDNRVPQPKGPDYCVFWPLRQERLETNTDYYVDLTFIGSIRNDVLTVEKVGLGTPRLSLIERRIHKLKWLIGRAHVTLQRIEVGDFTADTEQYPGYGDINQLPKIVGRKLFGVGLEWGTNIVKAHETIKDAFYLDKQYRLGSQLFAAGVAYIMQPMQVTYQLDVYGPQSEENVATVSTLFRDQYGVENYQGYPKQYQLLPLYTSDPRMLAFVNQEKQYERRWTIEIVMQANMVVENVPQQFAERLQLLITDAGNYDRWVVAAPPPAPPTAPWQPTIGDEVVKLERMLRDLHKKIGYMQSGKF